MSIIARVGAGKERKVVLEGREEGERGIRWRSGMRGKGVLRGLGCSVCPVRGKVSRISIKNGTIGDHRSTAFPTLSLLLILALFVLFLCFRDRRFATVLLFLCDRLEALDLVEAARSEFVDEFPS